MNVMRSTIVLALLAVISSSSFAAKVIYVNDVLRVGVRSEPVSGANTVSVIKTGEALDVLDSSDAKYFKVRTPAGRIGWVSRTYVSDDKPAFMRLEDAQTELDSLKSELKTAEVDFTKIQELNLSLEGELSRAKAEKTQIQFELAELKGSALIPEEYQMVAWGTGTVLLILLGYFAGIHRVRNRVRTRFGGLDV